MEINCLNFIEEIRMKQDLSKRKNLAIIQVGNNEASNLYIKSKCKEAENWNVGVAITRFPASITTEEVIQEIKNYNELSMIDGIIVQLPLPKHIDEQAVIDAIDPKKNVDGFKQSNSKSYYEPCTPMGIMMLLKKHEPKLAGRMITLIGRGKTVGEPLRDMLLKENATLAVCHSHTTRTDLLALLRVSDIVISAVGKPKLFDDFDTGAYLIIDAGISRVKGKQVGDFNHDNIMDGWVDYTPWTNGVGKLTVMALMLNVRKDVDHD